MGGRFYQGLGSIKGRYCFYDIYSRGMRNLLTNIEGWGSSYALYRRMAQGYMIKRGGGLAYYIDTPDIRERVA